MARMHVCALHVAGTTPVGDRGADFPNSLSSVSHSADSGNADIITQNVQELSVDVLMTRMNRLRGLS